jgi:hypothetical protein
MRLELTITSFFMFFANFIHQFFFIFFFYLFLYYSISHCSTSRAYITWMLLIHSLKAWRLLLLYLTIFLGGMHLIKGSLSFGLFVRSLLGQAEFRWSNYNSASRLRWMLPLLSIGISSVHRLWIFNMAQYYLERHYLIRVWTLFVLRTMIVWAKWVFLSSSS